MTQVIREAPQPPVRQRPHTGKAARGKRPLPEIQPRIRRAIRDLVHQGLELEDAAKLHRMTAATLRLALEKPSVLALLQAEADVLIGSARPGAIHRIITLGKSAASEAVKLKANAILMDGGARKDGAATVVNVNVAQPPGYVLAIDPRYAHAITGPQPDGLRTIEHKPLTELREAPSPPPSTPRRGGG